MKNESILAELAETLINSPAFAEKLNQLDVDQLRHQLLALAELRLLKELTDGMGNRELIDNLMRVVKPLTAFHLREKNQAESRKIAQERATAREQERRAHKAASRTTKPATPRIKQVDSPNTPELETVTSHADDGGHGGIEHLPFPQTDRQLVTETTGDPYQDSAT